MDVVDTSAAASLPIDVILEIFLRLEPAAVMRCAAVCKLWRRAIIGNSAIVGPHLDRFLGPNLLLGVFHYDRKAANLRRTPGPFQSVFSWNGGGSDNEIPANCLMPAAASAALPTLLSSKDGFILLKARSVDCLCLCNPVTGYRTIVPAAPAKHCKYILLTVSPSSSSSSDPAVRILAMRRRKEISIMYFDEETMAYQLFSTSGDNASVWGPVVQCSGDDLEQGDLCVRMDRRCTAVGQDAVYWLAGPRYRLDVTCIFALDVCTGRTWTMELPKHCRLPKSILGMSGDRRLFLVQSLEGPHIQVWVLCTSGDGLWILQRSISMDMCSLLAHCPRGSRCWTNDMSRFTYFSAFCPQSRCVVAIWSNQELLIDIDSSGDSSASIWRIGKSMGYHCSCCPYEIDSSTYISKMNHF